MTPKPFSLSARVLIQDEAGRWLMLRRGPDTSWNPGKWDFPGGKIKKGENLEEALQREVFEETGLEVSVRSFYGAAEDETHSLRVIHIVMTGDVKAGEIRLDDESEEYAWVEPSNLSTLDLCDYIRELARANAIPMDRSAD
jgi:8-oxo-dGTP diphosphatase